MIETCRLKNVVIFIHTPLEDCFCFQRCSSKQMFYKLAAYLQNTSLKEHIWETASASKGVLPNRYFTYLLHICRKPSEKKNTLGDCFCFQWCSFKQMFCKFAVYLQNTFLKEYLWGTTFASIGLLLNRCFTNLLHIYRTPS